MPNKTVYVTDERTISASTTNLTVRFGTLRAAKDIIISNFDTSYDITCKLNSKDNNSRTIKASQSLILNDKYITDIYLSNASSGDVAFSVMLFGG